MSGPLSFMQGKLPRYLSFEEHLALGVTIAWLPGFSHHVVWAALSDFMAEFSQRGIGAWEDFRRNPQGSSIHHSGNAAWTAKALTSNGCWRSAICRRRLCEVRPLRLAARFPESNWRGNMARGGYRFFDTDAHVGPYMDVLEPYLTADDKTRLAGWEQYQSTSRGGHISYNKGQRKYQRRLYY